MFLGRCKPLQVFPGVSWLGHVARWFSGQVTEMTSRDEKTTKKKWRICRLLPAIVIAGDSDYSTVFCGTVQFLSFPL